MNELLEMLKPGNDIEVYFNHENSRNEVRHILAIVDNLVVYKTRGQLQVEYLAQFQADFEGGWLRDVDVAGGAR